MREKQEQRVQKRERIESGECRREERTENREQCRGERDIESVTHGRNKVSKKRYRHDKEQRVQRTQRRQRRRTERVSDKEHKRERESHEALSLLKQLVYLLVFIWLSEFEVETERLRNTKKC